MTVTGPHILPVMGTLFKFITEVSWLIKWKALTVTLNIFVITAK
jgi:hypothetical protein